MNTSSKTFKIFALPTAALVLTSALYAHPLLPSAAAASTSTDATAPSPADLKNSSPAWSKAADYTPAVVNGNTVYYQANAKLIAADASTGKTKWSYAAKSFAPVVTLNNSVYLATARGTLVKLNASNGKVLWSKSLPGKSSKASDEYNVSDFRIYSTTLYVKNEGKLHQISAVNGKKIRTLSNVDGTPIGIRGSVIFGVAVESGAYTSETLKAYDAKTGRTLWEVEQDHNSILRISDGYLYTRYIPLSLDQGYTASIDKVDLKTGKIVKRYDYVPIDSMDIMSAQFTLMLGNHIYLVQQGELANKILRIPVDAPSETEPETFLKTNSPIVALEAVGSRMMALLSDGTFMIINPATGKVESSTQTTQTSYARLTLQKEKLFIQTNDKLSALKISTASPN